MAYNKKRAWVSGGFAGIPRQIMRHEDYRQLPANAVKLLNVLSYQYMSKNNGDLTASFSVMREWGFKSKETLTNAINALLKANLIIRTREGMFQNPGGRCALFAITWQPIDECPGKHLDFKPTRKAPRKWK